MEGSPDKAFEGAPKPFFSTVGDLPSVQMTGTKRTPRERSSVLNLSAFFKARETVSLFPATMT